MINIDIMTYDDKKGSFQSHLNSVKSTNSRYVTGFFGFFGLHFIAAPWTELHTGSVFRRISDVYIVCLNGARPTKNACLYSSKTIKEYDARGINLGSVSKNHRFVYCKPSQVFFVVPWYHASNIADWNDFPKVVDLDYSRSMYNVGLASRGFVESWESKDAHPSKIQ